MPRPTRLLTAADELDLIQRAIDEGFCTQESLAAALRNEDGKPVGRPTLTLWLRRKRSAPAGLVKGLLKHLEDNLHHQSVVASWWLESAAPQSNVIDFRTRRRLVEERQAADELAAAATRFLTLYKQAA